jgi:transcriptional regulator with XRE-family HTH domain
MIDEQIVNKIEEMKKYGLTATEIACLIGISTSMLSSVINGNRVLQDYNVSKLNGLYFKVTNSDDSKWKTIDRIRYAIDDIIGV